jgi:hypothetical protein
MRRFLLLLFALLWLALLLLPTLAVVLARNGQIQIGRSEGRHWRLFLLHDTDAEGLGLERGQPVAPPPDAPAGARCLRVSVGYWLWAGEGQGAAYCQCQDETTGESLPIVPPVCQQ